MSNLDWVETPKAGPHLFPIVQGQTEAFWHSGSRCSLRQWNYGCFDGGGDGSGLEAVSHKVWSPSILFTISKFYPQKHLSAPGGAK